MKKTTLYAMTESAVLVALAVILTYFEIEIGALGGSINLVMVPLLVIAYRHGLPFGIASGLVFGLVKCVMSEGLGYGLPSILLDYVLAYGAIGIAGIFKNKSKCIELSAFVGSFARYIIHVISGVTIYMITAPTEVMGKMIGNPFVYSLLYNMVYMLPSTVLAIIVMSLLRYPLKRLKKPNK